MIIKQDILDPLLATAIERGASDLALVPEAKPYLMIGGRIEVLVETGPISTRTLNAILEGIAGTDTWAAFLDAAARTPAPARASITARLSEGFLLTASANESSGVTASFRNLNTSSAAVPEAYSPLGSGKISSLETIALPEILAAGAPKAGA